MRHAKRSTALIMALLMLLSILPMPAFAADAVVKTYGDEDFESYTAGYQFANAGNYSAAYNQVLEEDGDKFLRLPIACSDAANPKTAPTNRGRWVIINHDAFSMLEKTSIKVDLRMNGIKGTTPNVGLWLNNVSYTDATGAAKTQSYYRLFDVNLLTGDFTFKSVSGSRTGAEGLKKEGWNTVEVIFDPRDGSFDIYVNDALYAECQAPVVGTGFSVGANQLMYCVCSSNGNANYTAAAALDSTYSNSNYMDADNFVIATATGEKAKDRARPIWSQNFETATSLDNVLVSGKTRPAGASLETSATDSGDKVLQFNIEATAPQAYYLVNTSAKQLGVLSGYTVSEDGKTMTGGSATVKNVASYTGVQGTINADSCKTLAKDADGNDIASTYICTGALADAQLGFLGNVAIPLYMNNGAMAYDACEDYAFNMDIYLSKDAKGTIASQITVASVDDDTQHAVQPFVFKADGSKATVQMNTNQQMLAGANKTVTLGEWHTVTVLIHKENGAASVFVDGDYAFTASNKTNSNAFYSTIDEPVSVVANTFMFQYNRWTTPSQLQGYLQINNLAMYGKTSGLDLKYYSEDFDSYTVGAKLNLGENVMASATYEKDPTDENNTVVKVPLTAKEDKTEILMRLSGTTPVEKGWYAVTRNAETGAVEVAGWTVTEEEGGTYTITDGTTTYTGLKLTTKDEYHGYWGGDGVVDQNWALPNPKIAYKGQRIVTLSVDYYLSSDANAPFIGQIKNYTADGASKSWMDLYTVYSGSATFKPYGSSKTYAGLEKEAWNNVTIIIDLSSGTMSYFLNGVYLETLAKRGANLDLTASRLMVAKPLRKQSNFRDFKGYVMIDNVQLLPTQSEVVTVEPENLMYVEINGNKIYTNTFTVPAGTAYKAVYFDDSDYAGMLTTEEKNSIRLSEHAGLRFATLVNTELLDQIYALLDDGVVENVTHGTLIAPTDYVTEAFTMDALEAAGKSYLTVEATRDQYFSFDEDSATTHFVGSIVNLYETNINRDFSGRGYVSVTLKSGQEITLYSSITHSADVQDVATRVLAEYPTGWSEFELSILQAYAAGEAVEVPESVQQIRRLNGLNVLAIGDSVFQGHSLSTDKQWLGLLAAECDWNMTNLGRNGWTVAYNPDAYADPTQVRRSMYDYLMNNTGYVYGSTSYYNYGDTAGKSPEDVDVIFFEGGWNDYGWGLPLGTADSTNCGTLMGARNLIIDKLLEIYPNATIVLVTTWHNADKKELNGETVERIDYVSNSIKEAAETRYKDNDRVVVVDMGDPEVSGAYMADSAWRATYAIDSVHLNEKGMEVVAKHMLAAIAKALFS